MRHFASCSALLLLLVLLSSTLAYASQAPLRLYGNLGYYYTYTKADSGVEGEAVNYIGSLSASSFLWKPWLATLDMGGTVSATNTSTQSGANQEAEFLSSRLRLNVLPRSRVPLNITYYSSNNLDLGDVSNVFGLGGNYRTRYLGIRQNFISRGGNRGDIWYNQRIRSTDDLGDLSDETVGFHLKARTSRQNFYTRGSYQTRDSSLVENKTTNGALSLMHQYIPNRDFYIKSLASHAQVDNKQVNTVDFQNNGQYVSTAKTRIEQFSSFFYWRPVYKPYTVTGAVRVHQRDQDNATDSLDVTQLGANGNISANYQVTRRFRMTASGSGTVLESDLTSSSGSTQNLLALYQADRIFYRGMSYSWYANGGVGNKVVAQFEDTSLSQNFSLGAGHNVHKRWVTGNRSRLRMNAGQSVREYFATRDNGSVFSLSHTASLTFSERLTRGSSYAQITAMDARSFGDELETQLVNFQLSRSLPVNRLSSWTGNVSAQSARRMTARTEDRSFFDGFLTTATGRIGYKHSRMFGIYKLKFASRVDLSGTQNRSGGDRKQVDWETRFGYGIGKLNTALILRWLESDSGLGTQSLIFQLNRSF